MNEYEDFHLYQTLPELSNFHSMLVYRFYDTTGQLQFGSYSATVVRSIYTIPLNIYLVVMILLEHVEVSTVWRCTTYNGYTKNLLYAAIYLP